MAGSARSGGWSPGAAIYGLQTLLVVGAAVNAGVGAPEFILILGLFFGLGAGCYSLCAWLGRRKGYGNLGWWGANIPLAVIIIALMPDLSRSEPSTRTRYCTECGSPAAGAARFCQSCGRAM